MGYTVIGIGYGVYRDWDCLWGYTVIGTGYGVYSDWHSLLL
jgi:hypothetical protein